jgi:hypothetical protein
MADEKAEEAVPLPQVREKIGRLGRAVTWSADTVPSAMMKTGQRPIACAISARRHATTMPFRCEISRDSIMLSPRLIIEERQIGQIVFSVRSALNRTN